ncbi:MAG TPA: NAD-dependent epimerase/dehydratase family protein [Micromonosporaceae bacterium]|nr:NAD-dependent epimerase/dehydratase family protein [Micromonosporaceae bacterium]
MRCLLLGATGFIGGHVRACLDTLDCTVRTASRSGAGTDLRVDLALAGPAGPLDILREVGPDVVVNATGVTDGTAEDLAAGNVVAVANLLDALDRYAHPVRLVHLGSAAEYGVVPAGRPIPESAPAAPVSAYGMSKLAGTALVLAARRHGRPATVLRVFNPLGPGTPGGLLPGRLVGQLTRARATGQPARVGNLAGHRDFVDVRDVARAVAAAAASTDRLPGVLNVGSGRATALRDLAALAAGMAGVAAPMEDAPGSARSAVVAWQQADIAAIGAALGWAPQIPLDASLRAMGLPAPAPPPP